MSAVPFVQSTRKSHVTICAGEQIFSICWSKDTWRTYIKIRDKYRCLWCSRKLNPLSNCGDSDRVTLDHLYPVTYGGDNSPFNMVVACNDCNSTRHHVDWRVYAQYINKEQYICNRVDSLQRKTYKYLHGCGTLPKIIQKHALLLYQEALDSTWGVPIDPTSGVNELPYGHSFIFEDSDIWEDHTIWEKVS